MIEETSERGIPIPENSSGVEEMTVPRWYRPDSRIVNAIIKKIDGFTHPAKAKAAQATEEMAPGLKISDEADASDLSPDDLELVDRVAGEVDRITGTGKNPQKK